MPKPNIFMKLGARRGRLHRLILLLVIFTILMSVVTLAKFCSVRSLFPTDNFYNHLNPESRNGTGSEVRITIQTVIQKIQQEMSTMRDMPTNSSSSASLSRYKVFLADILVLIDSIQASLPSSEDPHQHDRGRSSLHPLSNEPADYFFIEEMRKYVRMKPNRLGKQNFMGAN